MNVIKEISASIALLLSSCASTPPPAPMESLPPKTLPHNAFVEGDKVDHFVPLPNKSKIVVNHITEDGRIAKTDQFRSWDIDHDGHFDMVEALDDKGTPYQWGFDFDGDGVIDFVDSGSTANQNP